jgi:hypothetical protein
MNTEAERLRDLEVVVALLARRGVVVDAKAAEIEALRRVGDRAIRARES